MNVGSGKEISIRDRAVLIAGVEQYGGEFTWDTTKPNGTPRKLIMDNSLMFAPMATTAAFAEDHHESMKGFADLTDILMTIGRGKRSIEEHFGRNAIRHAKDHVGHDIGNKFDFIKTSVLFGLKHVGIGDDLRQWLKELSREL